MSNHLYSKNQIRFLKEFNRILLIFTEVELAAWNIFVGIGT